MKKSYLFQLMSIPARSRWISVMWLLFQNSTIVNIQSDISCWLLLNLSALVCDIWRRPHYKIAIVKNRVTAFFIDQSRIVLITSLNPRVILHLCSDDDRIDAMSSWIKQWQPSNRYFWTVLRDVYNVVHLANNYKIKVLCHRWKSQRQN